MCLSRASRVVVTLAATALLGCRDAGQSPTSPASRMPAGTPLADLTPSLDPFTYRGSIGPYRILQMPDYMTQSFTTADIVFQRVVFTPGAGAWVTHPGPSFVYVVQGQVQFNDFSEKEGCTLSQVHGVGDVFEVGTQVHRAIVLGTQNAVLLVTRFNVPVGAPITTPVPSPNC